MNTTNRLLSHNPYKRFQAISAESLNLNTPIYFLKFQVITDNRKTQYNTTKVPIFVAYPSDVGLEFRMLRVLHSSLCTALGPLLPQKNEENQEEKNGMHVKFGRKVAENLGPEN